jgi:hypothetical protein
MNGPFLDTSRAQGLIVWFARHCPSSTAPRLAKTHSSVPHRFLLSWVFVHEKLDTRDGIDTLHRNFRFLRFESSASYTYF